MANLTLLLVLVFSYLYVLRVVSCWRLLFRGIHVPDFFDLEFRPEAFWSEIWLRLLGRGNETVMDIIELAYL